MITSYYRVEHDGRLIGVLRKTKDDRGETAELFGRGNLSWGRVGAGIYDDGPETLAEISEADAREITDELLAAAREQ